MKSIEIVPINNFPIINKGDSISESIINVIKRNKSNSNERIGGSLASALYCYQKGVDIFRVHDVKETSQSLKVFKRLCLK